MTAFIECKSRATAKRRCPWAAKIAKVYGGLLAFEFVGDWESWDNQK